MKFKHALLSVVPFLSLAAITLTTTGAISPLSPAPVKANATQAEEYNEWLATWSQANHIYFHYNRGSDASDYADYALWVWQHAPKDLAGSLWAYGGNTHVSQSIDLVPMSTGFMTGAQVGQGAGELYSDGYGAIIDVDLTLDIVSGRKIGGVDEGDASLTGMTELGFLVVLQSSMGGGHHWTSDGGKNTYLENIDKAPKINGAVHVYINTGDFDNYAYDARLAPVPQVNPTTADTTGNYRSATQTIEDGMNKANSPTADAFKSLGVGYQVFVASFRDTNNDGIGDIRGVIKSIEDDYFKNLGVDVLWLTPIQKSDSYHGYDISDYYAVDPRFGTLQDYRELIYKAHKAGIKVLMDLVLNHTSKGNVWFKNSQWAKTSVDENGNTIDWRNVYHWKYKDDIILKYDHSKGDWSNKITIDNVEYDCTVERDANSKNPSWYRDGLSNYYYYGKFGSGMPEINYEYQPTRNLVKNMAKYWLSFGLDGFRLDAVKHIYMKDEVSSTGTDTIIKDVGQKTYFDTETGSPETKDFDYSSDLNKNVTWWKEFATDLKKVYPNCFLVGENFDGYGNRTAAYYQALDSQFGFNHYYHIASKLIAYGPGSYANVEPNEGESAFRGQSAEYWVDGAQQADLPGGKRSDFIDGSFTSNHDVMRAINHANWTEKEYKDGVEVGTIDNPNVTSNATTNGKAKLAAAITMLTPGISWIYYGDELGMTSNTNEHSKYHVGENNEDIWYRQPMKWGGSAASEIVDYSAGGFKIEWDANNKNNVQNTAQQASDPNSMLRYYQALGKIKALYPKNARVQYENPGNVMLFSITGDGNKQVKIFISCGWNDANCSIYGVDGMTRFVDPAIGTISGNVMNASTPIGTLVVYYS